MPRPARYSSSRRAPAAASPPYPFPDGSADPPPAGPAAAAPGSAGPAGAAGPSRARPSRRWLGGAPAAVLATVLLAGFGWLAWRMPPPAPRITQQDIDAAVLHTLSTQPLPSAAARAAEAVAPSVVRVAGFARTKKGKGKVQEEERGVGTGIVIVDKGVILTNLHVVRGAARIQVTFADGSESDASLTGAQPANDLAVLQARRVPDDLQAAPLRSTQGLKPGDGVVAIGFPFGIGPSVSAGVISGLQREFDSPQGKQEMRNLIQFDAAANPGNSGGPLVTLDGEVVGIVTAILNPTPARTFIGIGFAVPIENAAEAAGSPPF
ncbi:trypsin-like peptidase domain-containing protein [Paracidovorax citrulli]|uniref:Peptidase S1 and S6, chymotrypsin/Hap n=2 Tax=Paracidovorax citrulli TaxID=80869 RepID=A1TL23_PARC0|nr:trypsin-like peptidase domain-containing protein [Paracidovorax citrulli]ABM31661.1 peptidase S1 and S6, chymotrypsin/Hap [Paracidovorax citrulli AAC00-1]ATG95253.1 peptidase S1 [Paracidovorax citrulli]PVY65849.1 trypsin-like peptidase [Paracidovorax citrulli]QCX11582.1 Periplasmic serine endoprotease DegP [Paracidovorax citrulli]REG69979.1 trypsin-like peptidase [Paracidovorax citrulli]